MSDQPTTQQTTPTPPAQVQPTTPPLNQSDALSILEQAIAEASAHSEAARQAADQVLHADHSNLATPAEVGELAQVLPQTVLSASNTLNPTVATSTAKESLGAVTPDNNVQMEAGGGVQTVEEEKNPELSPEVEGFINKVENNVDQLPNEIVIADAIKNLPQNHPLPKQPVVIVPITPEIEKEGATKSPKFSIRWLVEWSHKVMKMFVGKVIYRSTEM